MDTKDRLARTLAAFAAATALAAAGGFTFGNARADSTTEPDAAALSARVAALEVQIDELSTWRQGVHEWQVGKDDTVDQILSVIQPIDCLAFSTYHGIRETIGPKGRKYHMFPIMLWNVTAPGCKPSRADFKRILRPAKVLASR